MIGQNELLQDINTRIENNTFPRFSIITGPKGCGKKTLCNEISLPQYSKYIVEDVKVDTIRQLIVDAYKKRNILFIIPDADTMSSAAQNSMLKVVEECPNDNCFIMTLEDASNTLPTILSRAQAFMMNPYSSQELTQYISQSHPELDTSLALQICDTPGEVELLVKYNVSEFWDYVEKVVYNIAEVSGSNSFKIGDKISVKEDTGYDLKFFWKVFQAICIKKAFKENDIVCTKWARITSHYISKLGIRAVNKQMLFDTWILDIRKAV